MGRRWVPIVIVVVGGVLGLAVGGFPSRRSDAPIKIQAVASTTTSTSVVVRVTTTPTTPTTSPPVPVRPPAEIKVTVFNTSGIPGSATRVGTVVKARGYDLEPPGADRKAQDATVIMYRTGFDNEARALATALGLDPGVAKPLDAGAVSLNAADVGVLVGIDLAKRTN